VDIQGTVPPDSSLGGTATGAVNTDMEWSAAAVKVAVESLMSGGDLSLVVADSSETGDGFEAQFASSENGTATIRPRLIIDYTPPSVECTAGSVVITRHEYDGDNPLPFGTAMAGFFVHFTITAGCEDLSNIKVQGGLASNTTTNVSAWWTCDGDQPCTSNEGVGNVDYKSVGKNNKVITWTMDHLAANSSATITIPVYAAFNDKGNAACGIKNFTGGWSVSALWEDANNILQAVSDGPTGQLVVELTCPVF
jgi:hypothetical protein